MAESPSELRAEIDKLERRHAENPEGRFFVPLANAYRKLGDFDRAESLLRQGIRSHPDYLSAHIVLGRCLADRGVPAEAAREFRHVLTVDPQNLIALRTLAELAAAEGRTDEAARWYEDLLAVDPMNEDARRSLDALRAPKRPSPERRPEAPADRPAAQARPPAPAEASPAGASVDAAEADEDAHGPAVVTETIAELYARQGLHHRAADVYRELIRRRNGDPALERRLAELEKQIGGAAAAAPPATRSAEPEKAPELEPSAEAMPEQEPEAGPVERPSEAFAESFESGFPGTAEPTSEAPAEPGRVPAYESSLEGIQLGSDLELPEPAVAPEPPSAVDDSTSARRTADERTEGPSIAEYLRSLVSWGPAKEERFPWEAPAGEQETRDASAEPEDAFDFDTLLSEPAEKTPPGPPRPAAGPVSAEEPEEPQVEPALPPPPAPRPEAAEPEDEDLESFQSWLRSLKR